MEGIRIAFALPAHRRADDISRWIPTPAGGLAEGLAEDDEQISEAFRLFLRLDMMDATTLHHSTMGQGL